MPKKKKGRLRNRDFNLFGLMLPLCKQLYEVWLRADRVVEPEARVRVQEERAKLQQQKKEMYSLWCTELYRYSIANKVRTTSAED